MSSFEAKGEVSQAPAPLLPCPFCGMQMTLQGDYTEETAWNFYCHADRDSIDASLCPMKDHQIDTQRDMRTPDHNQAIAWNTRSNGSPVAWRWMNPAHPEQGWSYTEHEVKESPSLLIKVQALCIAEAAR